MANVSIGGNRVVIHVDKMNNRKSPVLFVDVCIDDICYDEDPEGEQVQKLKITPVAFFRSEEDKEIFERALRQMFEDGGEVRLLHTFDDYLECMKIDNED